MATSTTQLGHTASSGYWGNSKVICDVKVWLLADQIGVECEVKCHIFDFDESYCSIMTTTIVSQKPKFNQCLDC
uniref:Apple domain-containing protein n=1 Tax=Arion vulgaris TaxID=1028688 RepID=A0A0B6XXL5_9EUPU